MHRRSLRGGLIVSLAAVVLLPIALAVTLGAGGLLAAVPADVADDTVRALKATGYGAAVQIGSFEPPRARQSTIRIV